eukprot:12570552-Alexandrium_andersonii.AAC.1
MHGIWVRLIVLSLLPMHPAGMLFAVTSAICFGAARAAFAHARWLLRVVASVVMQCAAVCGDCVGRAMAANRKRGHRWPRGRPPDACGRNGDLALGSRW